PQRTRDSDTYRADDTSTLPPTPLHDHTSSPPHPSPGDIFHAGCHSRRMTSFSSTMPFPLLTLNCIAPPPSSSSSLYRPAGLCRFLACT
ncbi:hypothetical protein KUCAC02_001640, partial [Chaenocephalus aceratus]